MEATKERLRKVYKLATDGSPGEREAAQRTLERLLQKYGLEQADIVDETLTDHCFEFKHEWEATLLRQITWSVIRRDFATYQYPKRRKKNVVLELTRAEGAEIRFLWEEYCHLYQEELQVLMRAFCTKHHLLRDSDSNYVPTDQELQDHYRASAMMAGLQTANIRRRLTGGEE
jgi:hypothetical protein